MSCGRVSRASAEDQRTRPESQRRSKGNRGAILRPAFGGRLLPGVRDERMVRLKHISLRSTIKRPDP